MPNVFLGLGSDPVHGSGAAAQPRIYSKDGETSPNGYFNECMVADWLEKHPLEPILPLSFLPVSRIDPRIRGQQGSCGYLL